MRAHLYLLIWLPVAILSILVTFGFLQLLGVVVRVDWPQWLGWPLSLLQPFVFGALCYRAFGRWRQSRGNLPAVVPGHLRRSASLYLIAIALGLFVLSNRSDKGFGLVAPLFVWPLMATLGGIVGDATMRDV